MLIPFIQTDGGMYMEKRGEVKTILGIALLYTIITSIFSFINRWLTEIMFSKNSFNIKINLFLQENFLWIIVTAAIIIILNMYIKKLNQGEAFSIIGDSTVRAAAGILVAIDGIITLSNSLPLYIIRIHSAIQSSLFMGRNLQNMLSIAITESVISIVAILLQILTGIYLAKFYKSKTS
jgi:Na+-transporting NADH:ubiquinone oxidoreductase subunit NqrE